MIGCEPHEIWQDSLQAAGAVWPGPRACRQRPLRLNHSIVGFGEVLFGIAAGSTHADWFDLARNTAIAVVGNVAGGVLLVAVVRSVQAR